MLLTPEQARELRLAAAKKIGLLVVVKSPALDERSEVPLDAEPLTIGREGPNDVPLPGDTFASAEHARFEARGDGVWLEDVGSTNGTYVNGVKLKRPRNASSPVTLSKSAKRILGSSDESGSSRQP